MYTITSEQIIGSYAVQYRRMVQLVNAEYTNCSSNTINIFIDLTDMIKTLGHATVEITSPYSIAASVINLCAHYRHFFREYYKTHAKFFIILSEMNSNSINAKSFQKYCRPLYSEEPKKDMVINSAIKLIQMLAPYIDDIHYQYTNFEFGVIVSDITSWETNNSKEIAPILILTKDPYCYQLVSNDACMAKILRPVKNAGIDESFIVNNINAMEMLCYARKVDNISGIGDEARIIDHSLMSLIFALTRVPERRMPSLHKLPTTISAISKLVLDKLMMNSYTNDIEYVCDLLIRKKLLNVKDPSIVRARFNAVDIMTQYIAYSQMQKPSYTGIVNLYDPGAVKEISMKYFKDNPLDLNVL